MFFVLTHKYISYVFVCAVFESSVFFLQDVLTDVSCGGGTALYAAILEAADHLEEFTKSYPSCRKYVYL